MITLKDAAEYVMTAKATTALLAAIASIKRIYSFTQERSNRAARYVAVLRAYRGGTPVQQMVVKYGCSRSTIIRYARMAELPKRPKHLPHEIKAAVLVDYANPALSVIQIAELNHVSPGYVSKVAREAGISRYRPRPKLKRRLKGKA